MAILLWLPLTLSLGNKRIKDLNALLMEWFMMKLSLSRANRKKYFIKIIKDLLVFLVLFLIFLVSSVIEAKLGMPNEQIKNIGAMLLGLFVMFVLPIRLVWNTICRLHDLDRPGSHLVLLIIPIYNIYFILMLFFIKGTLGANSYGDDPIYNSHFAL